MMVPPSERIFAFYSSGGATVKWKIMLTLT